MRHGEIQHLQNFLPTLFFCTGINTNKSVKDKTCCWLVFFYKKDATAVDGGGQFSPDKRFCYFFGRFNIKCARDDGWDGSVLFSRISHTWTVTSPQRPLWDFHVWNSTHENRESSPYHITWSLKVLRYNRVIYWRLAKDNSRGCDKPPPACSDGLLVGHSTGREAN